MDDMEDDDARYPPNPREGSQLSGYGSSANTQKLPIQSTLDSCNDDEGEGEGEEGEEEIGDEVGFRNHQNNGIREGTNDLDDEGDEDDFDDDNDDDDDDDDEGGNNTNLQKNFGGSAVVSERRTKKRKLKSIISSYEFAPRVPPLQAEALPAPTPSSAPKSSFGGRNALTDWTETETFVLLDAWGKRFQHGRKSLRSEEWHEVAEKVSEVSKIERTDAQCRNRLDTLKKKYKKEKLKRADEGVSAPSQWIYFKKMDALMSSPPQKQFSAAGVDSGEHVIMNPKVYWNRASEMDGMRDSPGDSEFSNWDEEDDDSDGLPPKKRRSRRESNEGSSFKLLADSILKFSDMYEKIENRKSQQMVEMEKMWMEFHRELEVERKQIVARAHAEIAKMMEYDEEENDDHSGENASG